MHTALTRSAMVIAAIWLSLPAAQAQSPPPAAQTPPAPTPPAQTPPAQTTPAQALASQTPPAPPPSVDLGLRMELQPHALDLLKAMSAKLAAAKTMTFTAIALYESPARTGQPLAYTTLSHVWLQRPDKLAVITPADGPPSEFYYDGRQMIAFEPKANLAAVADAPPTIDAMLKEAYFKDAIYFPFTDALVADPYKDIADGLKLAFVVGQSRVIGGTTTDIVALANDTVQAQVWLGAADHLPRMLRVTFFNEPGNYRHEVQFFNWHLDVPIAPGTFTSTRALKAPRMQFQSPDAKLPQPPATGGTKP
jgi:hypothetical protein